MLNFVYNLLIKVEILSLKLCINYAFMWNRIHKRSFLNSSKLLVNI